MSARILMLCVLLATALAGCAGQTRIDDRFAASLSDPYRLGSGDQLRVVVFGQEGLTNSYLVDAVGNISMPLVGTIPAQGRTPQEIERAVTSALAGGYLRNPSVSVQVETYRPFFILGEVRNPGKFTYVDELTGRRAVAIAGGFTPRAVERQIEISRVVDGVVMEARVPIDYPVLPGDTIRVLERWF
ncbi:polysaccharide biosynthesis/export family protein [Lutibaculum baratangense]|uniref:Polysaccharide export protein n=1 Tax=Lutibaculum baratangense AMV1 TaxID=631454 RepID=V4QU35_9HYPH|nr:polysaccharide biosynthesis/export family protein [Lutibaculum baratangense]ESR23287.1 Polysaccharide export protein [Lutibaculum baratangense AMV1]